MDMFYESEKKLHLELQRAQLWGRGWLIQSGVHSYKNHSAANWLLRDGIERARIKLDLIPNWLFLFLLFSFLLTICLPLSFHLILVMMYLQGSGNMH